MVFRLDKEAAEKLAESKTKRFLILFGGMVLLIGLFVLIYGFVTRNQNRKNAELEKEKRQQAPGLLNLTKEFFGRSQSFIHKNSRL